jgi:hypothetical protein
MTADFTSAVAKWEWARRRLAELDTATLQFARSDPYAIRVVDDEQAGKRRWSMTRVNDAIPVEIPVLTGEVVHALRCSLDHFVWVLNPTPESAFPIWRPDHTPTAAEWDALVAQKLGPVAPDLADAVRQLQIYRGGPGRDLWTLDYLDIVDKHRLVIAAAGAFSGEAGDVYGEAAAQALADAKKPDPDVTQPRFYSVSNAQTVTPLSVGTVIYEADLASAPPADGPSFVFNLVFGEPQELQGSQLSGGLHMAVALVERTLRDLERLT